MKAIYLFLGSVALLTAVACSDQDQPQADPAYSMQPAAEQTGHPAISLDSFRHTAVYTVPACPSGTKAPASGFRIRREHDSVTLSGAVYVLHEDAGHRKSRHACHFYFRAAGQYSYAYLRYATLEAAEGNDRYTAREAGYHLDFSGLRPVAG